LPNDTKDKAGSIGSVVSPAPSNSARSSTAVIDKKHDELRLLINSRNPIITVETTEEDRFEELLQTLSTELGVPLFTWTVTSGLAKWNVITGVQGCGKSLVARAVAGEWGIELVRLDAGSLYDKFVGESEKRLHRALDLAEKLSPVVLWIDEIAHGGHSIHP
jgi:SpoVK/Ycf46/Vps4 family AAA+-type ATPase